MYSKSIPTNITTTDLALSKLNEVYIENIHDTDSLVEHIHQLQRKCCGEELDKFLYNYALMEFLEERIESMKPQSTTSRTTTIIVTGSNPSIYPNATNITHNWNK